MILIPPAVNAVCQQLNHIQFADSAEFRVLTEANYIWVYDMRRLLSETDMRRLISETCIKAVIPAFFIQDGTLKYHDIREYLKQIIAGRNISFWWQAKTTKVFKINSVREVIQMLNETNDLISRAIEAHENNQLIKMINSLGDSREKLKNKLYYSLVY